MSFREINNNRTVGNEVVADPAISTALPEIGKQIITQNIEAKTIETMSLARMELQKLEFDYKNQWAHDPQGGLSKYQAERQKVFDKFGGEVNPLFRRNWNKATKDIALDNDVSLNGWVLNQTRENTITSVNETLKNNIIRATINGRNNADFDALSDLRGSMDELREFATANLGKQTADELLKDYGNDYMKSYISGIADSNPSKALSLLQDDGASEMFSDALEYEKMVDAVTNKVERDARRSEGLGMVNSARTANALVTGGSGMSYNELMQASEEGKVSPIAQELLLKVNGFASGSRGGVTTADKANIEAELYSRLGTIAADESLTPETVAVTQDAIMSAMHKGAISETQGYELLGQIVDPLLQKVENNLNGSNDMFWQSKEKKAENAARREEARNYLGFNTIKKMVEKDFTVAPRTDKESDVLLADTLNKTRQAKAFNIYQTALKQVAEANGLRVGDIEDVDPIKKKAMLNEAYVATKKYMLEDISPNLATLPDIPNKVLLETGDLIEGFAGKRRLEGMGAFGGVTAGTFKLMEDDEGNVFRVYADGAQEFVTNAKVIK